MVVCGPSGVGKSTLVAKLLAELPDRLGFAVSCTTRDARPGEVDGAAAGFKWRLPRDDSEPSGHAASLRSPGRTSTPGSGTQAALPPPEVAVHTALTLLLTRLQTNRRRLLFHLAR